MLHLYTILWYAVLPVIRLLSHFNPKWKAFFSSRNNFSLQHNSTTKKSIILHCASLGEYEQTKIIARGLISKNYYVIISFFSHSAFDILPDNNTFYHQKVYAPLDKPSEIYKFLDHLGPALVIFVKYEFWYNWLHILGKRSIPFIFISVNLKNKEKYFKFPLRSLFVYTQKAAHFFVQNQETKDLLIHNNYQSGKISVIGDNRVESIISDKEKKISFFFLGHEQRKIFVYGSIYTEEMEMIKNNIDSFPTDLHLLFPHELNEANLKTIQNQIDKPYTLYNPSSREYADNIILFDQPGNLKHIYRYGTIAYIGGGFSHSIHNVLEALVHKCPVIIGPRHMGFEEIDELSHSDFIEIIDKKENFPSSVNLLLSRIKEKEMNQESLNDYISKYANSSLAVMNYIEKLLR